LQDATSRRATTPSTSGTPPTSGAGETATAAGSSRKASSAGPAVPTPTVAVPEIVPGTLYLQVLASRESEPAREALLEFKSKGHPVTLDNQDPDWFRILVGPFDTREAADAYQTRLQAEGIKSFLRKF
jgi:cell division septation protein DedD